MHPDVQKLLDLQSVDQKIAKLRKVLDELPREREQRRARLDAVERVAHAARVEFLSAENEARNNDALIQHSDEEIKKLGDRLNVVKNNAEYQATLLQIESVKRERNEAEERGLTLIDEIEALRSRADDARQAADAEKQVFLEFEQSAAALEAEQQAQIDAVSAGRDGLVAGIPLDLLDKYQRIFEARSSLAVAAVEGATCTGCYSSVPPNLMVKVQTGSAVIQCDSCQRILYLAG